MKFFAENVCGHKFAPKRNINQGHYNVTSPFGCNCAKYLHTCAIPALIHTLIHTPIPAARSNDNHPTPNRHPEPAGKSAFIFSNDNHPTLSCHPELVSGSYKRARKNNNKQHKKSAFTLAELLTAILIISVIMVALAPVITKRMKDTVSVTTDNKKGLEIFTNPGTYTFDVPIGINTLFLQGAGGGGGGAGATSIDKSITLTSNTTWTVPKGVNKITLEITGAGGGGGAGNGKANTDSWSRACNADDNTLIRMASDEKDLCITKNNLSPESKPADGTRAPGEFNADLVYLNPGESSTKRPCWRRNGRADCSKQDQKACNSDVGNSKATGENRPICQQSGADQLCAMWYSNGVSDLRGRYRLPNSAEGQKFVDMTKSKGFEFYGPDQLNACVYNYEVQSGKIYYGQGVYDVAQCFASSNCTGADRGSYCAPFRIWINGDSGYYTSFNFERTGFIQLREDNEDVAQSVRCVRSIYKYANYSGSGGASGAVMEKEINVLPNDKLEISIGSGGDGGKYGTNANNGISSRSGNGKQGGTTKVIHKRGNTTIGTYYVKGGFGGYGATTSAHGSAITNGTSSSQTTPNGTCYANSNTGCTYNSYSGVKGTTTAGGDGGRVKNTGTITDGKASSGGYLYIDSARGVKERNTTKEANYAKGQNATEAGFGGGGGLTPAWATGTSHFYQGGKGGNGKVDISYTIALPGSGGGSGARVGGSINGNDYEIKYKVKEGDRIVFEIGSGGSGGISGQNGTNGMPTIIGDNNVIFLAGEGGHSATDTQKNNLSGCIGSTTNSTTIANCMNNSNYKGTPGLSGVVSIENQIVTSTTGLIIKDTSNVSYTVNPPQTGFRGNNGKVANYYSTLTQAPMSYGFDGGAGDASFGIRAANVPLGVTCAGGMSFTYGTATDLNAYICTTGNINGNNAKSHDAANNEFGGSGGGGGGVVDDSFELGSGGSGSSGYLRIRWDASEQE